MAEVLETDTQRDTEEEREKESSMTPWEQHSSVIIIPRFDYNAPSSLLDHSHSGFLITCPIKREKSATKEAMSILEKYVGSSISVNSECALDSDANAAAKRRKTSSDEKNGNHTNVSESRGSTNESEDDGKPSKMTTSSPGKKETNVECSLVLSLVKLTRSGILLFTFPKDSSPDTVDIVSNIVQSLESGILKPPQWCHRIFPVQATCSLNENDLRMVVSKLVLQFVSDTQNGLSRPVKFAVGYNRRGIEETEMKKLKQDTMVDSSLFDMLDRTKCFSVVAAAVKSVVSDSVVDLKSPELSVLVELLPLSRVRKGSLVAAVSVLPQNLVTVKPKLCIKALISDCKAK